MVLHFNEFIHFTTGAPFHSSMFTFTFVNARAHLACLFRSIFRSSIAIFRPLTGEQLKIASPIHSSYDSFRVYSNGGIPGLHFRYRKGQVSTKSFSSVFKDVSYLIRFLSSSRVNCSFYFKIGACRHGDRCSRIHNKPNFSQTILIQNLYQNPQNMPLGPDGQPMGAFEIVAAFKSSDSLKSVFNVNIFCF